MEKQFGWGDFRSKLILNHASSKDKKKKGCDR